MYKTKGSRISFERVSDAVRKHLGFRSNTFLMTLSERVRSFSFEHVWLVVRTRSTSRSNAFGFSFERVSNVSKLSIERVWTKTRYTLCLTGISLIQY